MAKVKKLYTKTQSDAKKYTLEQWDRVRRGQSSMIRPKRNYCTSNDSRKTK